MMMMVMMVTMLIFEIFVSDNGDDFVIPDNGNDDDL